MKVPYKLVLVGLSDNWTTELPELLNSEEWTLVRADSYSGGIVYIFQAVVK